MATTADEHHPGGAPAHPAGPGGEHPGHEFTFIVNGQEQHVREPRVSFEDVVRIAFPQPPSPQTVFTVSYRDAQSHPSQGDLFPGEAVTIKQQGTVFDVFPTGKS